MIETWIEPIVIGISILVSVKIYGSYNEKIEIKKAEIAAKNEKDIEVIKAQAAENKAAIYANREIESRRIEQEVLNAVPNGDIMSQLAPLLQNPEIVNLVTKFLQK